MFDKKSACLLFIVHCEKRLRILTRCGNILVFISKMKGWKTMNNIDIANGIIFQKMGIDKDSFKDRLICQKKIYLLQSLGTDLGYMYNWYVRGPYSPPLTNYVYTNLDVLLSNDFSNYKLANSAEKNVEKVNDLLNDSKPDFSDESWYELLASLLYIDNNRESWKIDNKESSLFDILMKHKPQYNIDQCEYAFSTLKKRGFVEMGV